MQTSLCTHASGHRIWPTNVPGGRQPTRAVVNRPATQQSPHFQQLSTIMLVNENLRRRLGRSVNRGLVPPEQLLQAVEIVQQADYAMVVARLQPPAAQAQQQRDSLMQEMRCQVAFANPAAAVLLCQQEQQQPQEIHLPAAVAALSRQYSDKGQQQGRQGEQQQSSLQVFGAVSWRLADTDLKLAQLLVCPVNAPNGTFLGLALLFDRWWYPSDGCIGAPGYPHVCPSELPTEQLLQGAADEVRQQADAVRQLKQGRGLSNTDPEVTAAVAELQKIKQQLEWLEGLQETFQRGRHGVFQELLAAYYEQRQ